MSQVCKRCYAIVDRACQSEAESYDCTHLQRQQQSSDDTEELRRAMIADGHNALAQAEQRWNTIELSRDFEVLSFLAPLVVVKRKSDGAIGSLQFTHSPRYYFNWVEDKK